MCKLHLVLSVPLLMKKLFPVQDGNSGALVTVRSLFRRPLSGTTFFPTFDTAVPPHSSELLLKPSPSLLTSLNYLDPQEDFCFVSFSWTAVVCVADLSVKEREKESE